MAATATCETSQERYRRFNGDRLAQLIVNRDHGLVPRGPIYMLPEQFAALGADQAAAFKREGFRIAVVETTVVRRRLVPIEIPDSGAVDPYGTPELEERNRMYPRRESIDCAEFD
jgi:hypothetical protein